MSKKVTMLEVWYYENKWSYTYRNLLKTLIRPEEFDDFRNNVYYILRVKVKGNN